MITNKVVEITENGVHEIELIIQHVLTENDRVLTDHDIISAIFDVIRMERLDAASKAIEKIDT